VAVAGTAPTAEAYDTAAVQKTEVAAARGAVALADGDAATAYRCCGIRRARCGAAYRGSGNVIRETSVRSTSGEPSIHASSSFGDVMRDSTASLARVGDRRRRHLQVALGVALHVQVS
jgi:hypothetical protein